MKPARVVTVVVLLATALWLPGASAASVPPPEEAELTQGIRLIRSGDFENAIAPLAAVIVKLSPDLRRREELARAYLYLGIAYLELGQELEARGKFRETLRNMPKTKLEPTQYSAQVRRIFEDEALAARPPKKKRYLPLVWIAGGGTAVAGAAVAATSGGDPVTTTTFGVGNTTTTTLGGGGPGTTTTTTQPSGGPTTTTTTTTTLPGTPTTTTTTTTTLPGTTTTTTSSTTTTTTTTSTTTTTTQPPSCNYNLTPATANYQLALPGSGTCTISAGPGCPWTVQKIPGSASWLSVNSPTSGTGNGSVNYSFGLTLFARTARLQLQQDPNESCVINQSLLLNDPRAALSFESRLDTPGARGQIVLNGATALFQEQAFANHAGRAREGANRIEAIVVSADGKPGTWRFALASGYEPGSLVVLAGEATVTGAGSVVFSLTGKPGQRFVFSFQGPRNRGDRN